MTKPPRTNDLDLRMLVVNALLTHGVPRDAIRHEITLDSASSDGRADIVVALPRELIGIEIKSGRDTLSRLETQRDQYRRRFDRMCLVVDEWHFPAGDEGQRCGYRLQFGSVALVGRNSDGGVVFSDRSVFGSGLTLPWQDRRPWEKAAQATAFQAPTSMLSLLWRDETYDVAARLVTDKVIPPTGCNTRCGLIPHLAEHAPIAKLRPLIAEMLRTRQLNRWEEAFWAEFDAQGSGVVA